MSLPEGSNWLIESAPAPTTKIQITATTGEQFAAKYVGISNPSEFLGEVRTRETKVVNIKQTDPNTGYVAFYTCLRRGVDDDKYEGSYYDNAGNKGSFRLSKV